LTAKCQKEFGGEFGVVIELTDVGFVIIVIIFYIFEAEWLLAKAKLAISSLTSVCLDVFRFLSLTMKVNLSSYTFFTIEHMDINRIVIFQYPRTKIIIILWLNFYLCFNLFKPVYFFKPI